MPDNDARQVALVRALLEADPELQRFTRAALAAIDTGPQPAKSGATSPGPFRSERTRRILSALQTAPLTPDELRSALPDVQATSLTGAVHALIARGYVEVQPARYALVANPTPRPITAFRAERRGGGRAHRVLTAADLSEADRALLGIESDMAIAARLGFERMQIRDLRRALGIAPVTRGGRGYREPSPSPSPSPETLTCP